MLCIYILIQVTSFEAFCRNLPMTVYLMNYDSFIAGKLFVLFNINSYYNVKT